jgi:hypothetical protein
MGVPEEFQVGFEMGKYYEHFGGEKMHIITATKKSDMWFIQPGGKMFIAETREGDLRPCDGSISSASNWYEITEEIFIENIGFDEYKFGWIKKGGTLVERFFLRIYKNNTLYLFDFNKKWDEDGISPNILENDYNKVLNNIDKFISEKQLAHFEKLLFERI